MILFHLINLKYYDKNVIIQFNNNSWNNNFKNNDIIQLVI